ncbi:SGNH/GDSL hydrolase family protein [Candidatus Altiarchaeota archaeon]
MRFKSIGLLLAGYLLLFFVIGEVTVRIFGFQPYSGRWQNTLCAKSPDVPSYVDDALLGYKLVPGIFKYNYCTDHTAKVTVDNQSHRVTSPISAYHDPNAPEIWVLGCSITYGQSLSDNETYPWSMQEGLSDFTVVNHAVPGYNTVQSFLDYRKSLADGGRPEIVVLGFSDIHNARNVAARQWVRGMMENNDVGRLYPTARFGVGEDLVIYNDDYDILLIPFIRDSAFLYIFEGFLDRYSIARLKPLKVTKALIHEFNDLSTANNVTFILAGLADSPVTERMLSELSSEGVIVVDISVNDGDAYKNLPHDNHPNALAHSEYSRKLVSFIRKRFSANPL